MASRDSGRTRMRIVLVGIAALLLVLLVWFVLRPKPKPKAPPHKVPVVAVRVTTEDLPLEISAIGAAQAWVSDMIYAQVSGQLISVNFDEGSEVRAGQVLAEVDPRPYAAALHQAQGTLKRDEATLAGARSDLVRYQRLAGEGGVSKQQLADQEAAVGADEGTVQIDRAAVESAQINLEFCRIKAPVSGRAGVRLVDRGNLVSASGSTSSVLSTASSANASTAGSTSTSNGSSSTGPSPSTGSTGGTGIVVINQVQPIALTFTVPEGDFQRLMTLSDGFRKPLTVRAYSQETNTLLDTGELHIADNRVDQNTGTVELKARFPNTAKRLWPGQFVNVRLTAETLKGALVVPVPAINRGPQGQYVFVVGRDDKVEMRPVHIAATEGQDAAVDRGLNAGDVVVVDGQMVLNAGSLVHVTRIEPVPGAAP